MSSQSDLWDKQSAGRVHKDVPAVKAAKAPAAKKATPAPKKAAKPS
jgi:hypothetical protein